MAWNLDFCEAHVMPYFSCELPLLFPLFCSDISTKFAVLMCSAIIHALLTILLILFSSTYIITILLSISSITGRSKAFSTCSSHLTAVTLYYGSGLLRHLMPNSGSPLELIFSVQYTVVTPVLNPLIYSLKNKEVKAALTRTMEKYLQHIRC